MPRQLLIFPSPDGTSASSYLKLQWALHHLEALEVEADAFLGRQPYPVRSEPDPETGAVLYRAVIPEQPPSSIGLLVGDIVHNLRAALDHLVWECVRLNGGTPTSDAGFPISHDATWFENVGVKKMLAGTAPEFIDIVRGMQPHRGADPTTHFLYTLNDLDVIDKHRAVLPVSGIVTQPGFLLIPRGAEDSSEEPRFFGLGVRDGDPVLWLPKAWVQPGLEPQFSRTIGIDVPIPYPDTSIVDRLFALYSFVYRERVRLKVAAMSAARGPAL